MTANYYVAIIDDEPQVCRSLERLFKSAGILSRAFGSAEQFLDEVDFSEVGCLVLDIRLTGMNGLELQAELRRRGVKIPIVVISGHATVTDAIRAFGANAGAFFEKPFDDEEFLATVERLRQGWAMEETDRRAIASRTEALTDREREVMDALVAGKKTNQIARELAISPSTVEKHRLRVFDKTGIDSVVGLVHLVSGRA
jgi:FixJ family two-component response regulator